MTKELLHVAMVLLLPAGIGCSQREPSASERTKVAASSLAASGGGQIDARPRVLITGPTRGASSIGLYPRINVTVTCPRGGQCANDPAATLALVATKLQLRNVDSDATTKLTADPLITNALGSKNISPSMNEYSGSFVTASPLASDATYALALQSDADVVTGVPGSSADDQALALKAATDPFVQSINLFTGSAPSINSIEVSNDPKKPISSIRVRFSEPVEIASLVNSGFSWRSRFGVAKGCVWSASMQACAESSSTEVNEVFDLMLPSALSVEELKSGQILVSGSVKGNTRTIAEAASLNGSGTFSPVAISLAEASWTACSQSGDLICASDLKLW